MLTRRRAAAVAMAAVLWLSWIATHYYAWPLARPEVADGVLGSAFPFWRDAAQAAGRAVAGTAVVIAAAWGFGRLALRGIERGVSPPLPSAELFDHPLERLSFGLATGFTALSSACVALAWLQAYRPPFLYALVAAGLALALPTPPVPLRHRLRMDSARFVVPSGALLPMTCAAVAAACALVGALAPEIEYDALWYHLWLPQRWLDAGGPVDIVHEYVSLYPLFWQLLYGVAMTLGGIGAAKLLHFVCLPLVASATWLLARRLAPKSNPWLAAALATASPIVIWEATTAYNDLALAWFLALATYALVRYGPTRDVRWLVLGAVGLGAALATKHLALLALAAVALLWLARVAVARAYTIRELKPAGLLLAIALIVPAPWYAHAWVRSGNPFFPDLYAVFGAQPPERWTPDTEAGLARFKARFGAERTASGLARLPWDMTVHGARYGGTLGPLFLLLVPFAWAGDRLTRAATAVAAGAAVYLAIWASPISSFQMRFVVPLVPVLAVLGAAGASNIGAACARLMPHGHAVAAAPIAGLLLLNLPPFTGWHERDRRGYDGWLTHVVRQLPARVVLGGVSHTQYVSERVPSFAAWQYVREALPEDARVLTFTGGDHLYGTPRRLWSDAAMALPVTWHRPAGEETRAAAEARRLGITHILFDRRQMAAGQLAGIALGTAAMQACCLRLVYEDARHQLFAIAASAGAGDASVAGLQLSASPLTACA